MMVQSEAQAGRGLKDELEVQPITPQPGDDTQT